MTPTDRALLAPVFLSVLNAVEWRGPRTVAVHGPAGTVEVDLRGVRALPRLRRALYETFHAGRPATATAAEPDEDFLRLLSESVRIPWTGDPGWLVRGEVPGGELSVERDGVRMLITPERHLAPGTPRTAGSLVTVRMPPCRPNLSPGFFLATGTLGAPRERLVRFYLNLPHVSVCSFFSQVTQRFEAAGLRYSLKTLADVHAYGRRDGTVLYTEDRFRPGAVAALEEILPELPAPAGTDLPPLTLRVLPQVGYAEEPLEGDTAGLSFGEQRCDAVARVLAAHHGRPVDELRTALAAELVSRGIDPLAPYRNLRRDDR
ncbi:T3SS effector HopA1 family protein [Streptomyces sp. NPDC088254]|uniref:T3SS effector HopA1 family protein n=1 Tax=Streptomyces sp. NPDC088254 TaxID=3365847 RepID=UPI0037F5FE9D